MKLKNYIFIAARGSGKTSPTLKMVERLVAGQCAICGEPVNEGQEVCIKCEKCIEAICENGSVYPITAAELEIIRANADKTSPDAF